MLPPPPEEDAEPPTDPHPEPGTWQPDPDRATIPDEDDDAVLEARDLCPTGIQLGTGWVR